MANENKILIETLMTTILTTLLSFILNTFVNNSFGIIIAFSIILSIVISTLFFDQIKDLKNYISNYIYDNRIPMAIFLFGTLIFLILLTPNYVDLIIISPFIISISFLLGYNRFEFENHYKIFAFSLAIGSILLFINFFTSYFFAYHILTDLYLNGILSKMPGITTISTYRLNYLLILIYSIVNLIFAYLYYGAPFNNISYENDNTNNEIKWFLISFFIITLLLVLICRNNSYYFSTYRLTNVLIFIYSVVNFIFACGYVLYNRILPKLLGVKTISNKKIILIIISIITLILLSSIIYVESEKRIYNETTSNPDFKQLEDEINKNNKNIIILSDNYTNSDNYASSGINITSKNLIIKGNDSKHITIDANYFGRIFDANHTENITFENIRFINTNFNGSAVLLGNGKNNAVINCTFENCYSENCGGAIEGNAINCVFSNCNAKYHGGAVFNGDCKNCTFKNCSSKEYGGAMYCKKALNSKFIECNSNLKGGALYNGEAINCEFIKCYSQEGGAMYDGSAFCCNFKESYTKNGNGGGMYSGSATGCTFISCYSNNGTGEAMYKGTCFDCDFRANNPSEVSMHNLATIYNFEDCRFISLLQLINI